MPLNSVQVYGILRDRLITLAAGLDEVAQSATIQATPLWTVRDVYSHMAGNPADLLAGETEGAGKEWWTQRQVDTRRDRSLAEVCREWQATAQPFAKLQASLGAWQHVSTVDLWHHEQDLRSTVGIPADRDTDTGHYVAGVALEVTKRLLGKGPAVRLRATDVDAEWVYGEGDPQATVCATRFDLARAVVGRRSRDQLLAFDWEGDAGAYLDRVHLWELQKTDLVE